MEDLEERLRRIEELLADVTARLEKLERLLANHQRELQEQLGAAVTLLALGVTPATRALEASRRALQALRKLKAAGVQDEISRTIIQVLAAHPQGLSISELTRKVREIRGKASRRTITAKVKALQEKGVLEIRETRREKTVKLRGAESEPKEAPQASHSLLAPSPNPHHNPNHPHSHQDSVEAKDQDKQAYHQT